MRDKFLTEAMSECWHELTVRKSSINWTWLECKCGEMDFFNNDFSTWEGFGKLWEWGQKQEWWDDFEYNNSSESLHCTCHDFDRKLINPNRFADTVYEYLKRQEGI